MAVTVTVVAEPGAVKSPEGLMVPADADQVTAVFDVPVTVAVNCCVPDTARLIIAGEMITDTVVGVGLGEGVGVGVPVGVGVGVGLGFPVGVGVGVGDALLAELSLPVLQPVGRKMNWKNNTARKADTAFRALLDLRVVLRQ